MVPIVINVQHAAIVVRELRFEINKKTANHKFANENKDFKTMLVCLVGDAAMKVLPRVHLPISSITVLEAYVYANLNHCVTKYTKKLKTTREMGGVEISMQTTSILTLTENTKKLINSIQISLKFVDRSLIKNQSNISTSEAYHTLRVVNTIEEAKEWIRTTKDHENIQQQTAVDVIRAEIPHVPILIFPNRHEHTQLAHEFPNAAVMSTVFELYEFLGVAQATQWNTGYQVEHLENETSITTTNPYSYIYKTSKRLTYDL
ncbi:hypothetical protein I4U23_011617 [Adineta vaga]|nr:hypothetical protein I4U23_011617 [Adineta vaga]